MGKVLPLLGYETLLDDLMVNSAQIAEYLGISRSRLAHIVSGRNKPGNGIITELSKLASKLDEMALHPQTLQHTALLRDEHEGEMQNEQAGIILKLNYGIAKTTEAIRKMEAQYEHAMQSFNNIQFLMLHAENWSQDKKSWLMKHSKICEAQAYNNRPAEQFKLKMKLEGLKAELKLASDMTSYHSGV